MNNITSIAEYSLQEIIQTKKCILTAVKKLTPDQLIELAFHEAGHVVVSRMLDVAVVRAFLDENMFGVISLYEGDDEDNIEERIMVCQAGEVAQRKHNPKSVLVSGLEEDQKVCKELAVEEINRIHDPDGESDVELPEEQIERESAALLKNLHKRTRQMVKENWSAIKRVAKGLLVYQVLNAQEVEGLISEHPFTMLELDYVMGALKAKTKKSKKSEKATAAELQVAA